jgi:putative aldouronate transport system permease protein
MDQTMVMTNDMVNSVAEVLSYYVYRVGLLSVNQFSYSTAVGLFNSMLSLIMVLMTNWVAKKLDEEGGLW